MKTILQASYCMSIHICTHNGHTPFRKSRGANPVLWMRLLDTPYFIMTIPEKVFENLNFSIFFHKRLIFLFSLLRKSQSDNDHKRRMNMKEMMRLDGMPLALEEDGIIIGESIYYCGYTHLFINTCLLSKNVLHVLARHNIYKVEIYYFSTK